VTRLLVLVCAMATAVLVPSPAYAAGPSLSVSPESGGPGSVVTLVGHGFCARSGCSVVSISMAGRRFAPEQRVSSSGSFRVSVQVSGGYAPGALEVTARQVLDDGNEVAASAEFTYTPSKGEEAEREAETNDQTTHLVNPSAPVGSPKGVPLASYAASFGAVVPSSPAPSSSSSGAAAVAEPGKRSGGVHGSATLWLLAVAAVAGSAVLVVGSTGRRRARHAGPVAEGSS
jgi:hypothetical protein